MCSAVVVLVEVSLLKQTRTRRVTRSSDNIVFEDSRGAQVVYTGDPGYFIMYRDVVRSPYPDPIMGSRSRGFS